MGDHGSMPALARVSGTLSKKTSWVWCYMPVIPQEVERGFKASHVSVNTTASEKQIKNEETRSMFKC
jgi:hypothetical protein